MRLIFLTIGAKTSKSEFKRFRLKIRILCSLFDQLLRVLHLDIDELSAFRAKRVIMTVRHAVETAGTISEPDLGYQPRILQVTQAVINGREADAGKKMLRPDEYFIRREVLLRITDHSQHYLTLLSKSQILYLPCFQGRNRRPISAFPAATNLPGSEQAAVSGLYC